MDGAAVEATSQLISRVPEHRHHVGVLGQHLGFELLESAFRGGTGEVFEQDRAQSPPLVLVGDHEGNLGRPGFTVGCQALVDADGDDLAAEHADERDTAVVVHGRHPREFARRDLRERPEVAQVARALGQPRVEADETVGVLGNDRAQMDHAAVAGENIGDPVTRVVVGAPLIGWHGVSHGGPPDRVRTAGTPLGGWP